MKVLLRLLPFVMVISIYSHSDVAHQLTVRYLPEVDISRSALMDVTVYAKVGNFYDCGHGCNESRCIYNNKITLAEEENIIKLEGYSFNFSEHYLINRFYEESSAHAGAVFDCARFIVKEGGKTYDYDAMFSYDLNTRKFNYFSPPAVEQFMS